MQSIGTRAMEMLSTDTVLSPIVNDFDGGAPLVDKDTDAAVDAGCQRKAANQAPPTNPLNVQGAFAAGFRP